MEISTKERTAPGLEEGSVRYLPDGQVHVGVILREQWATLAGTIALSPQGHLEAE